MRTNELMLLFYAWNFPDSELTGKKEQPEQTKDYEWYPEALQGAFSHVSSRLSKGFRCSLINSLKMTTGHLAMLGLIKGKDSIGWSWFVAQRTTKKSGINRFRRFGQRCCYAFQWGWRDCCGLCEWTKLPKFQTEWLWGIYHFSTSKNDFQRNLIFHLGLCCRNLAGQEFELHWPNSISAWGVTIKTHGTPVLYSNLPKTAPSFCDHHKTCPDGSWHFIQMGTFPSLPNSLFLVEPTQDTLGRSAGRLS